MNYKKYFFLVAVLTGMSFESSAQIQEDSARHQLRVLRQYFMQHLPAPTGYVNDYEHLFTDVERATLDSLIRSYEKKTTVQIAVVTLDSTMVEKDSLEVLTLHILRTWGVGQKETNNGVLIGICKGHRKMRIENGYGIEQILSNAETKNIVDQSFIPAFKEGNYYEGTRIGLLGLMNALDNVMKKAAP